MDNIDTYTIYNKNVCDLLLTCMICDRIYCFQELCCIIFNCIELHHELLQLIKLMLVLPQSVVYLSKLFMLIVMKIFYILCYAPYFMLCSLPSKKTKCPKPPLFSTSSLLNLYTSNTYTLSLRTPELIHPKELYTRKKYQILLTIAPIHPTDLHTSQSTRNSSELIHQEIIDTTHS